MRSTTHNIYICVCGGPNLPTIDFFKKKIKIKNEKICYNDFYIGGHYAIISQGISNFEAKRTHRTWFFFLVFIPFPHVHICFYRHLNIFVF